MNAFTEFLSSDGNLAVLLSSLVSICVSIASTIAMVYQSKKQYKETSMKLYFEAQYKAYTEFYSTISELDVDLKPGKPRDVRKMISAAKTAELLSPSHVADVIDNFCSVYLDYLEESDSGKVSKITDEEFRISLLLVTKCLSEELRRYDFYNKDGKQNRKKLKKYYSKLNS